MDPKKITDQIDKLEAEYKTLRGKSKYPDELSDLPEESNAFVVRLRSALDRFAPGGNSYAKEMAKTEADPTFLRIPVYIGILRALRADIDDDWLEGVAELLHAETFSDLLDQATELLTKQYKDAAAVIAGSALESHIRLLCVKFNVSTQLPTGQPKKADVMNADLVKASAYNTLQQKAVTALLGIRNSAAHGQYGDYDDKQVTSMIASVREFMIRYPA